MGYDSINTIVIAISGIQEHNYGSDLNFINFADGKNSTEVKTTGNDYVCILTGKDNDNVAVKVVKELNDIDTVQLPVFIYYNQLKKLEFTTFKEKINSLNKNVLIWRHNTDNNTPECSACKGLFTQLIDCIPFSHTTNDREKIEIFMKSFNSELTATQFTNKLNTLISDSLKKKSKPYLIALSILCQGYLAANKEGYLPENISIGGDKKPFTLRKDWWKPVLGENLNAEEVSKEIAMVKNDSTKVSSTNLIDNLIKMIKGDNWEGRESGSSDFRVEEFKGSYTIKSLSEAFKKDKVVPANKTINTIEELNELLKLPDLYSKIKHNKTQPISEVLEECESSYNGNKAEDNLKRLNRVALEEFYPQETPKSLKVEVIKLNEIENFTAKLEEANDALKKCI